MTSTTTEERALCAVCLTPASKCDGKTCQPPSARSAPPRPTDRQLAILIDTLDAQRDGNIVLMRDDTSESIEACISWLRDMVPAGVIAQLNAEFYGCSACGADLIDVGGNIACPACEANSAVATNADLSHATGSTTEMVRPVYDSINASKAAAISARAAARDAIARGVDPFIVVDLALREIAHFRQKTGLSMQYVAQDPLAALVGELRHKRVPHAFARVVGALAAAGYEKAQMKDGYDDGHERRIGDWSLLIHLGMLKLAAFEGSCEDLVAIAIEEAEFFAGTLPGWQEAIHEDSDLADPKIQGEIESAADGFIVGLSNAHREPSSCDSKACQGGAL